jgi:hypothetical protein
LTCSKSQSNVPIFWRRRAISANTIGGEKKEGEALPKICNAVPIRQDIAY